MGEGWERDGRGMGEGWGGVYGRGWGWGKGKERYIRFAIASQPKPSSRLNRIISIFSGSSSTRLRGPGVFLIVVPSTVSSGDLEGPGLERFIGDAEGGGIAEAEAARFAMADFLGEGVRGMIGGVGRAVLLDSELSVK
jgi:hypothetical protein